ncbi:MULTISPECIES: ABC transporter ATP-binding protein [unclassified Sporosarcina]|uniref:ABC transporter ATP-binding protein n=1 Tax=unclassified Sporosarcina TaxID=2647733 RepID=UPI000C1637AA|nr:MULTISPECIES: ABC transporter ATP-binding protein [unclassified Sporosarcina]PIC98355.1 hemin ABC transporter ATP-binding protein [Sporosarcina sp. P29]PID05941.1 hemin ABC transporter ATP-binding protein [Sporosarcina sp. P30]PID09135.1 hemin ABC transporter ATP-binding protein [Sporosarcina sp. P31]PID12433.1 hemin ABC transporter ATP-binding protein [Sporosarcina sp. P32b]
MVLELRNAKKTFGEGNTLVEAMKETNFVVERGELVAVIGPSGSGKSTFLTVAGGLQTPSEGEVIINGKELSQLNEKQRSKIRLQEIGFILQASNLVPFLTVDEQLELLNKVKKDNMSKDEQRKLYEDLGITKLHKNYPSDLSGGERQRVAIAKALFSKPAILLADEPTASLDSDRAFEVMELLRNETKSNQTATIVVTHDVRLIKYVDKVYKMTDGVLRLESSAEADVTE